MFVCETKICTLKYSTRSSFFIIFWKGLIKLLFPLKNWIDLVARPGTEMLLILSIRQFNSGSAERFPGFLKIGRPI